MKKILHVFDINALREKIFDVLTTKQGLSGWWTTNVSVENGVEVRYIPLWR